MSCAWTGCVGVCDAILSALIAVCFLVVGAPATLLMRRCTAYWSSSPRSTSTSSSLSNSVPLAGQQPTCYHNPATWVAQCRRVRSLVRAEATVTGCGARGQIRSTAFIFLVTDPTVACALHLLPHAQAKPLTDRLSLPVVQL